MSGPAGYTCWTEEQETAIRARVNRALDDLVGSEQSAEYGLWVLYFLGHEVNRRRRAFRRPRDRAGAQ